jgi:hypothetical protein
MRRSDCLQAYFSISAINKKKRTSPDSPDSYYYFLTRKIGRYSLYKVSIMRTVASIDTSLAIMDAIRAPMAGLSPCHGVRMCPIERRRLTAFSPGTARRWPAGAFGAVHLDGRIRILSRRLGSVRRSLGSLRRAIGRLRGGVCRIGALLGRIGALLGRLGGGKRLLGLHSRRFGIGLGTPQIFGRRASRREQRSPGRHGHQSFPDYAIHRVLLST